MKKWHNFLSICILMKFDHMGLNLKILSYCYCISESYWYLMLWQYLSNIRIYKTISVNTKYHLPISWHFLIVWNHLSNISNSHLILSDIIWYYLNIYFSLWKYLITLSYYITWTLSDAQLFESLQQTKNWFTYKFMGRVKLVTLKVDFSFGPSISPTVRLSACHS